MLLHHEFLLHPRKKIYLNILPFFCREFIFFNFGSIYISNVCLIQIDKFSTILCFSSSKKTNLFCFHLNHSSTQWNANNQCSNNNQLINRRIIRWKASLLSDLYFFIHGEIIHRPKSISIFTNPFNFLPTWKEFISINVVYQSEDSSYRFQFTNWIHGNNM